MSPPWPPEPTFTRSFPRVSGDEPQAKEIFGAKGAFSPRERG